MQITGLWSSSTLLYNEISLVKFQMIVVNENSIHMIVNYLELVFAPRLILGREELNMYVFEVSDI